MNRSRLGWMRLIDTPRANASMARSRRRFSSCTSGAPGNARLCRPSTSFPAARRCVWAPSRAGCLPPARDSEAQYPRPRKQAAPLPTAGLSTTAQVGGVQFVPVAHLDCPTEGEPGLRAVPGDEVVNAEFVCPLGCRRAEHIQHRAFWKVDALPVEPRTGPVFDEVGARGQTPFATINARRPHSRSQNFPIPGTPTNP